MHSFLSTHLLCEFGGIAVHFSSDFRQLRNRYLPWLVSRDKIRAFSARYVHQSTMKAYSALISVSDQRYNKVSIYITIGGQPHAVAHTLTHALSGSRAVLHARRLILLIACAIGYKRLRSANLFFEDEFDPPVTDFRYEIELPRLRARQIRIFDAGGNEYYRGTLENFINFQSRKLRRPRGRTPRGFTRDEWIEHQNLPRTESPPAYVQSRLREEVLRERSNKKAPLVDLSDVRVYTKEEYLARSRAERKARNERFKALKNK